jgi:hypothetical protein
LPQHRGDTFIEIDDANVVHHEHRGWYRIQERPVPGIIVGIHELGNQPCSAMANRNWLSRRNHPAMIVIKS